MVRRIASVDDVIDALGGKHTAAQNNGAVAAWLKIVPHAVCNWRERRLIPTAWHLRIYLELVERRGYEVDMCVFGGAWPHFPLRANGTHFARGAVKRKPQRARVAA